MPEKEYIWKKGEDIEGDVYAHKSKLKMEVTLPYPSGIDVVEVSGGRGIEFDANIFVKSRWWQIDGVEVTWYFKDGKIVHKYVKDEDLNDNLPEEIRRGDLKAFIEETFKAKTSEIFKNLPEEYREAIKEIL